MSTDCDAKRRRCVELIMSDSPALQAEGRRIHDEVVAGRSGTVVVIFPTPENPPSWWRRCLAAICKVLIGTIGLFLIVELVLGMVWAISDLL